MYVESLKTLAKRILYVTLFYSFCRLLFVLFHYSTFDKINFINFLGGIRFDVSVIIYTNLLIIIGHSIPGGFKYGDPYQKILKLVFFITNSIFLATNFIDLVYFEFTGRRSTFDLITAKGMETEIMGLIPSYVSQYWYVALSFLVFITFFWKFIPNFKTPKTQNSSIKSVYSILGFVLVLGLSLVMGRGGIQEKPLSRIDAVNYSNINTNVIVLNTPFCIMKTLKDKEQLAVLSHFEDDALQEIYTPIKRYNEGKVMTKKNIVIIIAESFGDENISYSTPEMGNTPFLDSLISQSIYFPNGYANGRLSSEALPSILTGIPSIFGEAFINSSYAFNDIESLPKILAKQGYESSFFHGAFNGSQNFDHYAKVAGFDAYYGKDEYPTPGHEDGKWGIYDEEFLRFFGEQTGRMSPPFLASIFTISSHMPFVIPNRYKGAFGDSKSIFHESVGYTDYAIKKYFEYAKTQEWYPNTIFVITADHCSMLAKKHNQPPMENYAIPLLIFDPSNDTPEINLKNIQQIDIIPSVLDYLDYPEPFFSFGNSYKNETNLIVNLVNNNYQVIIDNYYFIFDGEKITELYDTTNKSGLRNLQNSISDVKKLELEQEIKAFLQTFNNNFINNTVSIKEESQ
mgnify:FL=1